MIISIGFTILPQAFPKVNELSRSETSRKNSIGGKSSGIKKLIYHFIEHFFIPDEGIVA